MRKKLSNIILILVLLTGLSLLLYPTVSDYWNSFHSSRAITSYTENVAKLDNQDYETMWEQARAYNEELAGNKKWYLLTEEEKEAYNRQLNVSGDGVMGYIEISKINCSLPIYHGTDEAVLQIAVGHIEGTSLPVGGQSTHCVLSGHRGLPSAKLFTNLDQIVVGDTFVLRILDETLTYEVDQILIVEPQEADALGVVKGKDYCTLVTCTPYGINTHRLLVRGHRVDNEEETGSVRVTADAIQVEAIAAAPFIAIPLLLLLWIVLLLKGRKSGRK